MYIITNVHMTKSIISGGLSEVSYCGGVGAIPICTGEPCVTFIKLICTGEQPCVTFIKLICTGEPRVTFNFSSSLTYYKGNYKAAHVCPVDHNGAT